MCLWVRCLDLLGYTGAMKRSFYHGSLKLKGYSSLCDLWVWALVKEFAWAHARTGLAIKSTGIIISFRIYVQYHCCLSKKNVELPYLDLG